MSSLPISLPPAPALHIAGTKCIWLTPDGELEETDLKETVRRLDGAPAYLCGAHALAARLQLERVPEAFDLLDLFAFVRPAQFCPPTPQGLADALGLPPPESAEDMAALLPQAAGALLQELAATADEPARQIGFSMARGGWIWGQLVSAAAGLPQGQSPAGGLDVWRHMEEWEEEPPRPPAGDAPVSGDEATARLRDLLHVGAEERQEQQTYAGHVARAFIPREMEDAPQAVLAEAGTGVGKTLGYIAPASLWARRNQGTVWLSTFTKNLQRQIDQELDRLMPDPAEKAEKAVIRKGRENYLCLLNFQEAMARGRANPGRMVDLGLMARWAAASRDGDMIGGDLPGWLVSRFGGARVSGLTDRRGECIYAACEHYRRCFIEKSQRKAKQAELVIANHALVMIQAVLATEESEKPLRLVLDEGHHLFDAADGAFSAYLSGVESSDLRRWLRGVESGAIGRARGLMNRIGDLLADYKSAYAALKEVLDCATQLPGHGWQGRITGGNPLGPGERFLALLRSHVLARAQTEGSYSLEASLDAPAGELLNAADDFRAALDELRQAMLGLAKAIGALLNDEADELDSSTRVRLDAARQGILRRTEMALTAWVSMLSDLAGGPPDGLIDWAGVEKIGGREIDVGLRRHHIDPTEPFAQTVLQPAHGAVITSATLRDRQLEEEAEDWSSAEMRTGLAHLPLPAQRRSVSSPFDYPEQTRIFIVRDVAPNDPTQMAHAFRALFEASGGGALGLFTAIARLRRVHHEIAGSLAASGLPLYAQHVDPFDVSTLVEMFRADLHSCLLGTDAVRDGVDVPGQALRLIVFDRVPWPRPNLLHKARREAFGGRTYDEMLTRLKLKQAFGRLIRKRDDHGVFVMLDARTPTRLLSAFPEGVEVTRCGLSEAVAGVRDFLA